MEAFVINFAWFTLLIVLVCVISTIVLATVLVFNWAIKAWREEKDGVREM